MHNQKLEPTCITPVDEVKHNPRGSLLTFNEETMKHIIALILIPLIFGCSSIKEKVSPLELNVADIVDVLQLQKWLVKIPDDLKNNQQIALKLTYKEMNRIIGHISSKPGEIAEVMIWKVGDSTFWMTSNEEQLESTELKIPGCDRILFWSAESSDHECDIGETLLSGSFRTFGGSIEPYRLCASLEEKEH